MALFTRTVGDSVGASDALALVLTGHGANDEIDVTDGLTIRLSIAVSRSDAVSVLDVLSSQPTIAFNIDEVRALTETKVRIDFERPALNNDALTQTSSYTFDAVSAGAVEVTPLAVLLPPGQPNPLYVEIVTTEHTNAATYEVALSSALRGSHGEVGHTIPVAYSGIGSAPTLQLVIAISPTEAEVHFSEAIANNASANDPNNYVWSDGISTVDVRNVVDNVVTLQTTAQAPGEFYTLTVLGVVGSVDDLVAGDVIVAADGVVIELVDGYVLIDDESDDPLTDDESDDFLTIG